MSPAAAEAVVRPLNLTEAFKAELRQIKPLTLDDALKAYADRAERMNDEQLTREFARIEALPGGSCRHLIDELFEYRQAFRRALDKGVLL